MHSFVLLALWSKIMIHASCTPLKHDVDVDLDMEAFEIQVLGSVNVSFR